MLPKFICSKLLTAVLLFFFLLSNTSTHVIMAASWPDSLSPEKKELLKNQPEDVITYFERYFDPNSADAIDVSSYKRMEAEGTLVNQPIGVFDSGTGGLAVLEALKKTLQKNETYIFYADQANMPWGEYPINQKRTDTLKEIMMGIYQWLLTTKFNISNQMKTAEKKPVKSIVVACNTATAYSLKLAKDVLALGRDVLGFPSIPVFGIIDSGAEGAILNIKNRVMKSKSPQSSPQGMSVAVFATSGTVDAGAYPVAINKFAKDHGIENLAVYQQAGVGLAGAIDHLTEFIDLKAHDIRETYQGPKASSLPRPLNDEMWKRFNFSKGSKGNGFFAKKSDQGIIDFQLNSVENYIRFSVALLLDKMLQNGETKPLHAVIFGCTHYPYFQGTFVKVFKELRNYKTDGKFVFRHLIDSDLALIDPSENLAQNVKASLVQFNLERKIRVTKNESDRYFISVPRSGLDPKSFINHDPKLGFTSEYKHEREVSHGKRVRPETLDDIARVPMGRNVVDDEVIRRLKSRVPQTFESMTKFSIEFSKTNLDSDYRPF